ncbi:hypothetical protein [Nocardioides lianchengensis]|uniref:Uncharacterized protein n=1 Tax=Nocardioides lianchengensis TaxID=1045774 RepID=A0A1G6S6C4_9ACTN|nr:hypothetical protein [Nocardioides lianchengensis]NYG09729.1 hypothetical protein [Nocardioides lianchengensis]SDD12428.1 hypothetical protein SAMN05421872_10638 [Nocardioides lianchengensis]
MSLAPPPVRTTVRPALRRGVLALLLLGSAASTYAFLDQPWYAVDGATRVVNGFWQLPDDGSGTTTLIGYRTQRSPLLWLLLAICVAAGLGTAIRRASVALAARITAAFSGSALVVGIVVWTSWTLAIRRETFAEDAGTRLSAGFVVTVAALVVLTVAGSVGLRRDASYDGSS